MEQELRALVRDATGVDNTNWMGAPDDAYPAIDLNLVSEVGQLTHDGPARFRQCLVQIDVWASDVGSALTIRDDLLATLNGYSADDDAAILRNAQLASMRASSETTVSRGVLYRYSMDFRIWYRTA